MCEIRPDVRKPFRIVKEKNKDIVQTIASNRESIVSYRKGRSPGLQQLLPSFPWRRGTTVDIQG